MHNIKYSNISIDIIILCFYLVQYNRNRTFTAYYNIEYTLKLLYLFIKRRFICGVTVFHATINLLKYREVTMKSKNQTEFYFNKIL